MLFRDQELKCTIVYLQPPGAYQAWKQRGRHVEDDSLASQGLVTLIYTTYASLQDYISVTRVSLPERAPSKTSSCMPWMLKEYY